MRVMTNTKYQDLYDLIIIGSGISGLTAARMSVQMGKFVLVIDKGRRIGGRCSTKRQDGATFNHGAQFFTCKDTDFSALITKAQEAGAAHQWEFGHHAPSFGGAPTMRDLPQFLADDSDFTLLQNVTITQINEAPTNTQATESARYHLYDQDGTGYYCRQLLITTPAPQAEKLLAPINPALAKTAASAVYDPCWTVMLALEAPLNAAAFPLRDKGMIGWANYEPLRNASHYAPALTIQASPAASNDMLSWDKEEVIGTLVASCEEIIGQKLTISFSLAHRWLYARVSQSADATLPFITDDKTLALAGDYFGTARLETAFLSGRRAAQALG